MWNAPVPPFQFACVVSHIPDPTTGKISRYLPFSGSNLIALCLDLARSVALDDRSRIERALTSIRLLNDNPSADYGKIDEKAYDLTAKTFSWNVWSRRAKSIRSVSISGRLASNSFFHCTMIRDSSFRWTWATFTPYTIAIYMYNGRNNETKLERNQFSRSAFK